MIRRRGFVSNSSSSSFLIIVPRATHDAVYNTLTPYERAVADTLTYRAIVVGQECVVGGYFSTMDSGPFDCRVVEYEGEPDEGGPTAAWDKYVAALKATGEAYTDYQCD